MPTNVNETNWDQVVEASQIPTLLKLGASWCGPCKVQERALAELEPELGGRLQLAYVDIDKSPGIAARFGVKSVPSLYVIHLGRAVAMHTQGVLDVAALRRFVAPWS